MLGLTRCEFFITCVYDSFLSKQGQKQVMLSLPYGLTSQLNVTSVLNYHLCSDTKEILSYVGEAQQCL